MSDAAPTQNKTIRDFLKIVDVYMATASFRESANKETSVSSRIFNDGKKLTRLRDGTESITVPRLEAATQWLSDNWPDGAEWPEAVDRPAAVAKAADLQAAE